MLKKVSFSSSIIVLLVVILGISIISGHLEWTSSTSMNIFFWNGPAKSMWTHTHGLLAHNHGCNRETKGTFLTNWHGWQACTNASMSWSMWLHQQYDLAKISFVLCLGDLCEVLPGLSSATSVVSPHECLTINIPFQWKVHHDDSNSALAHLPPA